ncbi:MAG TPA: right-handed parallel beta-helix repeat-containing protein [Bacteroidota bacterium]|nr:right-handed parallel beta-helix repeat-containing protein [Bacteroidota bacterium]
MVNVVQPVVLVYVDFVDGRLPDGSAPIQDADTALVANIDAVGSMGYADPRMGGRKMVRKYVYEDYWNMFFSANTYVGPGVHPDYSTHNGYTPIQSGLSWSGQIYDLTVYGSVRDYWDEVSCGNFQIQPAQTRSGGTDMYHTGIVNKVDTANGRHFIRWITVPSRKSRYVVGDTTFRRDVYAALDQRHALDESDPEYLEFDRSTFEGKIGIIAAGGLLGGWAYQGGTEFFDSEKLWNNTNDHPSCVLNGITVLAHEFGHTIGFEHMAVGSYDLMHWGGFNDRRYYFCPPHINPLAKLQRHWLTRESNVVGVTSSGAYAIAPITSERPQVAIATVYGDPGRSDDWNHSEYFLIEYRKREKFNRFVGGPDNDSFAGGGLIWHYSKYGSCWSVFTVEDHTNSGIDFSLALEVAGYGSGYKGNTGSPSDLFYSGHGELNDSSAPNSRSMNNYATGIALNDFSTGSNLTFHATYSQGPIPAYTSFYRYVDQFPTDGSLPSGAMYIEGYRNTNAIVLGNGLSVDFAPQGGLGLVNVNSGAASFQAHEAGSIRLYRIWNQSAPLVISGNTAVTFESGSQFVLTQNATLTGSKESTLYFDRGSAMSGAPGSSLMVYGSCVANGDSIGSIVFDRLGSSGRWEGIFFQPMSRGSLRYCTFRNATHGVYAGCADHRNSHDPALSVEYCTFEYNLIGLYLEGLGASLSPIQNNTFFSNYAHGMYITDSWPQSISGNVISKNGGDGICLNNSSGLIVGNTISGNGMNGIYCYNQSAPEIRDNVIESNRWSGVQCDYFSPAILLGGSGGPGHNVIRKNNVNVWADYSSNMIAGNHAGFGLNSMYEEQFMNVAAGNQSHIEAGCNYWGGGSPSAWIYGGGTVDHAEYLTDDPNAGIGKDVTGYQPPAATLLNRPPRGTTESDTSSFFDADLLASLQIMLAGSYDEAILRYAQRCALEKDPAQYQYLLTQLAECYIGAGRNGFVGFLNSGVRPNLSNKDPLYATTLELENYYLIRDGKYDEAAANFETLARRFADDTATVRHALFGLWSLNAFRFRDGQSAGEYLALLKAQFPNDALTWHAKLLSGEIDSSFFVEKIPPALPSNIELLPNFPNPFNLTTTIRYTLPAQSSVTLTVYDILGRSVATLVQGPEDAGYHEVLFDGTGHSSGVYFYRFRAGNFVRTRKLILLK